METTIDLTLQIMQFVIVGAFVSAVINTFKGNLSKNTAKLFTILMSLAIGVGIAWLWSTEYVDTVLMVLGSASTIYGFVLKGK